MTNSVSVVAPASGTVGTGLAISGTVSPAADTVSILLSQQNATLPSGNFVSATTASGAFNGVLVPAAPGTWYAWAWDQATGAYSVSSAIVVAGAGASAIQAFPVPVSQISDLVIEAYLGQQTTATVTAVASPSAPAPLTAQFNTVPTVPANGAVQLATISAGLFQRVFDTDTSGNTLSVYPPEGHQIGALGVNQPAGMVDGQSNDFCFMGGTQWEIK